ncbi:hypothetical protein HETIRDRAFT_434345, partial [Heterobasidion irregulare TC 32-1]
MGRPCAPRTLTPMHVSITRHSPVPPPLPAPAQSVFIAYSILSQCTMILYPSGGRRRASSPTPRGCDII